MTLIVALQGCDGSVLAGDSRGTIGDPRGLTAINDSHTKLFQLTRTCGVGISGASELALKLIDELKTEFAQNSQEEIDKIVSKSRETIRRRYDDWFAKFPVADRPGLNLIFCGFHKSGTSKGNDPPSPRTYLLTSQLDFAPQLAANGNMMSGVPQYATYLQHRLYNPGMSVNNLVRLAAYLIAETATQDPKVGGPVRIATLKADEGFRELDPKRVDEIIKLNEEQNEKLKQFFFGSTGDVANTN
jgi:20S proteasome alpha/beta subunit